MKQGIKKYVVVLLVVLNVLYLAGCGIGTEQNKKITKTEDNNFIYGLYITDEEDKTLSLFDEFKGKLNNLYFSNTLINITKGMSLK